MQPNHYRPASSAARLLSYIFAAAYQLAWKRVLGFAKFVGFVLLLLTTVLGNFWGSRLIVAKN